MTTIEEHLREALVSEAQKCVGIREHGSNRGKEVEQIQREGGGKPGDAWCAEFCAAMLKRACKRVGLTVPFRINPNVDIIGAQAKSAGRLIDAANAQPGDLLLLGKALGNGRKDYHHVGIVIKNLGGGQLLTIEGNTNDNGSSEGNGCYQKQRHITTGCSAVNVCRGTVLK